MADGNVAQQALAASNLTQAIRMRARGANWREVCDACGFSSPAAALRAVGRAMADATLRAEMTADQMRDEAQLRLESLLHDAMDMIAPVESERYDAEGNPLGPEDDRAVRLRAVDESRRIVADIAKLQGVATPPKREDEQSEAMTVRIIGLDPKEII